jgi:SSS family solute:Na+ symporter
MLLGVNGQLNYLTLALGSAVALFLYPHTLTAVLAARNRATLRRNLAAMPLYTLALGALMLTGFAAVFDRIQPVDGDANTVVPMWFNTSLPDWTAGLAFAAIGVGAMVPAAIMSIAAANRSPATSTVSSSGRTPRSGRRPRSARSPRWR